MVVIAIDDKAHADNDNILPQLIIFTSNFSLLRERYKLRSTDNIYDQQISILSPLVINLFFLGDLDIYS